MVSLLYIFQEDKKENGGETKLRDLAMKELDGMEPVAGVVSFDTETDEPTVFSTTNMPHDEGLNDIQVQSISQEEGV